MTNSTNRLATIATRQRSTRLRDAIFATCVAVAMAISIGSITTACEAATTSQIAHH